MINDIVNVLLPQIDLDVFAVVDHLPEGVCVLFDPEDDRQRAVILDLGRLSASPARFR